MKREHPFEIKMRMSKFPSQDAAHEAIRVDSLVPGYLFEQLRDRGLIEHKTDGSVAGIQKKDRKPADASKTWGACWPTREIMLKVLALEPYSFTLTELKAEMASNNEPSGHWAVLHALRVLTAEGTVKKEGNRYSLATEEVPAAGSEAKAAPQSPDTTYKKTWGDGTPAGRKLIVDAIAKVGANAKDISEHIGTLQVNLAWGFDVFPQPFIDWVVKANKEIES